MRQILLYLIFFLSGVAGLGYEILWTRMLSAGLGHEIVSALAVVSAFFSGLAVGAWFLDRPISKSANPERWYALLEIIIGLWALVLIFILPDSEPHRFRFDRHGAVQLSPLVHIVLVSPCRFVAGDCRHGGHPPGHGPHT